MDDEQGYPHDYDFRKSIYLYIYIYCSSFPGNYHQIRSPIWLNPNFYGSSPSSCWFYGELPISSETSLLLRTLEPFWSKVRPSSWPSGRPLRTPRLKMLRPRTWAASHHGNHQKKIAWAKQAPFYEESLQVCSPIYIYRATKPLPTGFQVSSFWVMYVLNLSCKSYFIPWPQHAIARCRARTVANK